MGNSGEQHEAAVHVVHELRADGSHLLRCAESLGPFPNRITESLEEHARATPDRLFIAQRNAAGGWEGLSYSETLDRVERIASALLRRAVGCNRPLVILSGNDLDHALLALAAMHVGVPVAPLSASLADLGNGPERLRDLLAFLTPGLVFTADGQRHERILREVVPADVEVLVSRNAPGFRPCTPFDDLLAAPIDPGLADAVKTVTGDTIAKLLFSSGTTGSPKCVITTHRMLASNQQMLRQAMPEYAAGGPRLLDWLPWHHALGGNRNFGLVLYNGGSFYIDDGRPLPGRFMATLANLADVAPNMLMSVPRTLDFLNTYMRENNGFARKLLGQLGLIFYAGAGLSQAVLDGLRSRSIEAGVPVPTIATGLGCTECGPGITFTQRPIEQAGYIGTPHSGIELKLVPVGTKYELRAKGPNVTPGYWRAPELTAMAFDEEGYFRTGDAVRFMDAGDPGLGLLFDGRINEDFKLSSGTWVNTGPLRSRIVQGCAPLLRDVVLTGLNRPELGALLFPDLAACRSLVPELPFDTPVENLLAHPRLREHFQHCLNEFAAQATGSANRIARAMLMEELPTMETGEATDKGSLNCSTVLQRRASLVDRLYADGNDPAVFKPSKVSRSA